MDQTSKKLRPIDAPFYRYWHALYMAFYSGKLYVDVAKRWKGKGYLYLLFMVTVFSLPFSLQLIAQINHTMQDQIFDPLFKIPQLTIQQGQVHLDKPMPYLIQDSEGNVVLAIDTTGTISSVNDKAYPHLNMLITSNQFMSKLPDNGNFFSNNSAVSYTKVTTQTFSKEMNEVFEGRDWVKGSKLNRLLIYVDLIIIPSIIMVFYGLMLVFSFVLTLLGQFLSKLFMKFSLSFQQSAKLVSIAITPITAIIFVGIVTMPYLPSYTGLVAFASFLFYFSFGVFNLKAESGKLVR